MLRGLGEAGLKLAVLSNKPDDATREAVGYFLGEFNFEIVLGAVDGEPHKPDPTGAIRIAKELAIPPAKFLYVGDTDTDMQTARGAGMFAVGVLWGFRPAEELTQNGADTLIEHPTELLKLL